ncbi:MAG: 2-C-methyl-D-erythritol 2,4-cyclodiphosphate synthase [Dehalococcoidia bacterium]|nr:2-C-methyl-D-erythritol 2,4-cyclodiphosphate synthase [Dehalococcoidia bacterium]
MKFRTGIGVDIHRLVEGRELALGGIIIPHSHGLEGHSDGDALIHAIIDACLGAANLGDIGTHFSSEDPCYSGIHSVELLLETALILARRDWRVEFIDATILAERPILRPHIGDMRAALANALGIGAESVSLKATTADHLGFVGRREGICCMAVATITQI